MTTKVKAHKRNGRIVKQHTRKASKEKKAMLAMNLGADGNTKLKDFADKKKKAAMVKAGRIIQRQSKRKAC